MYFYNPRILLDQLRNHRHNDVDQDRCEHNGRRDYVESEIVPEAVHCECVFERRVERDGNAMPLARNEVSCGDRQRLPSLVVAVAVLWLEALHDNFPAVRQKRRQEDLCIFARESWVAGQWRTRDARFCRGCGVYPGNDPLERELAGVHFVVEAHWDASSLGGVWAHKRAHNAGTVVQSWRCLREIQPVAREGAAPAEPREVLAVPVVADVVLVVRIVIPKAGHEVSFTSGGQS